MKKKWIQVLIAAGISLAAIGGVFAAKDSIVIYLGIRMFRLLQVGVIGAGALITGGTAVSSAVTVSRLQDQLENSRQEQLAIEEQHRRQTARLSVQGKLDNATLRRVLTQKSQDNWSLLRTQIEECITQLTSMDDYQERLRKLRESNGADMLYDTEQAMCRNVRKVINYMEVADDKLAEDFEMVRGKVDTCREANQGILKQSQEFVFALTEYLNRQGDSSDDMSMLEIYKKTILESIQDGGE